MFENANFTNNTMVLCERSGKNADMLMDIRAVLLKAGESIKIYSDTDENAAMLLQGEVDFVCDERTLHGKRANPFDKSPYAVHTSKGVAFEVVAIADSEIIIQSTNNENTFPTEYYTPDNVLYQEFGKEQWNGAGYRVVSTLFDNDNAPLSNMVLGEVYNQPGCWSSYPPHSHPQPEVYYYRFDKPQGFGACFNGDDVYKSTDRSFSTIRNGQCHQQVVGPGYTMYYVWMIRHLDGDTWYKTTRNVPPEHQWMLKEDWSKVK